ncbi:efflux RND transporter permease subunit, partial [candidate division KSB1 bacterium]|nr:efflux RND transporter permease subunit [candidate division KSB1 bacterium]
MRLPKLAIENHQFTIIVTLALTLAGIFSFLTMPRSEDPAVSAPGASVIILYPGANPVTIEQLVIQPIEEELNELEDVQQINSRMYDDLGIVAIEFNHGIDPDQKYSDVLQKINSLRPDLPAEILSIRTQKWAISDVNILQIALTADSLNYKTVNAEAERLKKQFEKIDGVKNIKIWAVPEQEVRVALDFSKIALLKIPLNQIIQAIQSANFNIPGGNIDLGSRRFSIQTSGSFQSLEEIKNTVIRSNGSQLVHLKDIARVYFESEDQHYYARFNRTRAIFVTLQQKAGANIFAVNTELKASIDKFKATLPAGIKFQYVFDQSESVAYRVNDFFNNLLQGMLLVGVIIFMSLNFRASIIVMLVIPLSILMGILLVDVSGFSLEQMSIAGLVIALGMLVDNAIVVTENISRFLKNGFDHKTAAIEATREIGWPIVSATVTTLLSFIPIVMMGDVTGDFIRSMPVTVIFTLSASLLVALTLTPYLASRLLKATSFDQPGKIQKGIRFVIEKPYRNTLDWALKHHRLVLMSAGGALLLSLALFPLIGISFFPKAEKPQFIINIETPKGTSLSQTDKVTQDVESVLTKYSEIRRFAANIGRSNPRIYYNSFERHEISNFAQIMVEFKTRDLKIFSQTITALRQEFRDYPGAKIEIKELEQGPPVDAPITIRILGDNLEVLKTLAQDVEQIMKATPGAINIANPVSTSKTDLKIQINREKAGLLNVPLAEIDRTVRACITGLPISKYRDQEGEAYNIVLRLPLHEKPVLADFDKIYVASLSGALVPLKQMANVTFQASHQEINHHNLEREVMLTA